MIRFGIILTWVISALGFSKTVILPEDPDRLVLTIYADVLDTPLNLTIEDVENEFRHQFQAPNKTTESMAAAQTNHLVPSKPGKP